MVKFFGVALVLAMVASTLGGVTGPTNGGTSAASVAEIIKAHTSEKVDVTVDGVHYSIVTLDSYINTTTLEPEEPTYKPVKVYVDAAGNPVSDEDTIRKIGLIDRARRLQSKGVLALDATQQIKCIDERLTIHGQIVTLELLRDACNLALVVAIKAYCNQYFDLPEMIIIEASRLARKTASDPAHVVELMTCLDFRAAKANFTEVLRIDRGGPITDYTVAHDYFEHYYTGLALREPAWHALDKIDEIGKSLPADFRDFCLDALGGILGGNVREFLNLLDALKAADLVSGYIDESNAAISNVNNRIPWTLNRDGEYTRDLAARSLHKISVPDLTVTSTQATPLSAEPGDTISVTFTIKNKGNASSGSFANRVFLSKPPYPYHTDRHLGTFYMDSLTGGSSAPPSTVNVIIPRDVPPSNYYVTVYTDAFQVVEEPSGEGNNIGSTSPQMLTVTMPQEIDLVVSTLTAPSSLEPGETTSVSFTVKNLGSTPSGSFTNSVFLSTEPGDIEIWIGDSSMGSLAKGVSQMTTASVTIPPELPSNEYYITVFADGLRSVDETNESNNMYSTSSKIPIKTTPSPAIAYSPSGITFPTAVQGGYNPPSQTLKIWNSGGGTLDWSVSDDATWLILNRASGSCTGEVNSVIVSADTSGKSPGSYSATISISAPGATNSPRMVPVSLTITSASYPDLYISKLIVNESSPYTGQQINIQATVANQGGAPSSTTKLKYYFSTNGISREIYLGESAVSSVQVGSPITVSRSVTIPDVACGQAYIIAVVNPDNAILEENFGNNVASTGITVRVLDTEAPNISYLKLQWGTDFFKTGHEYCIVFNVADNVQVSTLDFYYSTNNGTTWNSIATNFVPGSNGMGNGYLWTIPWGTPLTTEGRIKMIARDASDNAASRISDNFSIIDGTPPGVTVLSPKGGEVWDLGSQHEIKWTASSTSGNLGLSIYLYYADRAEHITTEMVNDGSYNWTLPASSYFVTDTARIRIKAEDENGNTADSWSEGYFSINDPSLPPPAPWTMPERVTTVPSTGPASRDYSSPRIAVDNTGTVHLVYKYTEDSGITPRIITQKILYRKLTGSSWSSPELVYGLYQETYGGGGGCHNIQDLQIAVDNSGNPHIVWTDTGAGTGFTSDNFQEIYYSYRTASSWTEPLNIANNSRVADFQWWMNANELPEPKCFAASAVVSGKIYAIGGSSFLQLWERDPAIINWTRKADLPGGGLDDGGAAVVNGKIYAVGLGFAGSRQLLVYNPVTDTWQTGTPMPSSREGVGVAAVNGKIYAIGGSGANGTKNEMYDPATNTWTPMADMPTSRGYAAVAVVDNLIYVIGGIGGGDGSRTKVVQVYDPTSNTWGNRSSMPTERSMAAVGVVNNRIYVVGGFDGSSYLNTVEVYYPSRDMWTTLNPVLTPRTGSVGAVVNNTFYVIGGVNGLDYLRLVERGILKGINDENPTVSAHPRIAIDPSDNVHVVWQDGYSYNSNRSTNGVPNIYYKKKEHASGNWSSVSNITGDWASYPDIATDNLGNLHLVFEQSGKASYMVWNGTAWSPATEVVAGDHYFFDVVSDAGNKLHLAWYNGFTDESSNFWQRILYSYYDGNNWSSPEEVSDRISGHYPDYPSVVADSLGRPYIIWEDNADGSVNYKRKSPLGWSDGIRLNLESQYAYADSGIAISDNDHLYVVWCSDYNGHTEIFYNHADVFQDITPPKVTLTAPSAGEHLLTGSSYNITWNSLDDFATSTASLEYTVDNGSHYTGIATNISDTGHYEWTVPNIISEQVQIRVNVSDTSGNTGTDTSDYFSIGDGTPPNVNLISPNGGEVWAAGSQHNITWEASDNILVSSISLLYSIDAGLSWTTLATNLSNSGSYLWTIPNQPASTYKVKVIVFDTANNQREDVSNGNFTVAPSNNPPNIPNNPVPADEATNISVNVDLSWSGGDPDLGDAVVYDVYMGNTTNMTLVSSNQTEPVFDPGILEYETSYLWKVVATDSNGASASSPVWSFQTELSPVPDSPTGLTAEAISDTQINLHWIDKSNNELGFKIERKIGTVDAYTQLCTVGVNATSFNDTNLTEGVGYYYRVCAYGSSGNSSYSNEANATTWIRPVSSFAMYSQQLLIGQVGYTIVFNASSSFDLDGIIDSWQWEFGDGNTTAGETAEHAYSSPGNYTVNLTVTDNNGLTDISSENITIVKVGDVNADGVVNATDLTGEERTILGLDYPAPGADPNQDCKTSSTDITKIELVIAPSSLSSVSANAATVSTVSIDAPTEAMQGDTIVARVNISTVTDFDACNFDVTFDNSVLWVTDVTEGNISGTTIPVDIWSEITTGTIRVVENVPGTSGVSGSNYLAEIHFQVIGSPGDTSPIDLHDCVLGDKNAQEIPATLVDSSLSVVSANTYNLTISSTAGGNVTDPGEGEFGPYDNGMVVNLTATADLGYHFVNWTGDIGTIANSSAATTNITMYANYSITANFAINNYNLTVTSTTGGNVTVPGEGEFGPYNHGTVVNLTTTADTGYHFVNWTGDTGTIANSSAANTTITMYANYSIAANFEPEPTPPSPSEGGGEGNVYYISVDMFGDVSRYRITWDGDLEQAARGSSHDGRITISLSEGTACLDKDGKRLTNISVDEETDLPSLPENYHIIDKAYKLEPSGAIFDPYLNLALSYVDNNIPQNVSEENIYIAYYNATVGIWVPLDSQVDTQNNTVTAQVGHFTIFAIVGTTPPPSPAEFTIVNLDLSNEQVQPGQEVIASVNITNIGGSEGSYALNLSVNGVVEQTKTVTLAPQATKAVAFTITKEEQGSYNVSVDGWTEEFTVLVPPPSWLSRYWWTIVTGIVIAGLLVYFLRWRRRTA